MLSSGVLLSIVWPGDQPDAHYLGLGLKLWGRLGKVLQYLGGLTALIDIAGPTRIRSAREALLNRLRPREDAGILARLSERWIVDVPVSIGTLSFAIVMSLRDNVFQGAHVPYTFPYILIAWGATLLVFVVWLFVGAFLSMAAVLVLLFPAVVASARVAEWLARSDTNLKVIGFIVISTGFSLDLLAS